jgi:predicted permease
VLALGIGVSTLAFSLYNLLALQSIPVRDAQSVVRIQRRSPENITPAMPYVSVAYFRDHARTLTAVMAAMSGSPMVINQDARRVTPSFVTANYFSELGGSAAVGRLFDPVREEDPAAPPVAVLSYRFWQTGFAGDASIVGKTIYLAGRPATVIGVTAPGFANLGEQNPEIWLPLMQHGYFVEGSKRLTDPDFDGNITMWGRLAAGATSAQAAQELLALTNRLRPIYPALIWKDERILVTPAALLVLLILVIACANLGGLLTARGAARQREIELRIQLGARRSRLFRQLLTENLLLGMLGSIAALPLGYAALRFTLRYANAPEWMSALPDWRVVTFTGAMGVLAAFCFGLLPTLRMVRRRKGKAIWNQFVVCAQVGASCVLMILAGLLVRATLHTLYTNPGFGYQQVVAVDPGLDDHGFTPASARNYLDQLQGRLRAVPGVLSVSTVLSPPLVNNEVRITSIDVDGHRVLIYPNWVGPEFFQTMGIPLLRGRYLRAGESSAVVISQSLARRRWPNENPIGKQWKDGKDTVVGVVGNTRAMEMNNTDAMEIYYPESDVYLPEMSILIRTAGTPLGLLPAVKAAAASVDPRLLPAITPLEDGYRKSIGEVEQIAAVVSLLGGIAIFLAVVGLLGLVSYAVSQRTREIAIRLALGASRGEVVRSVLRRFAWPVCTGLVFGIGVTAALSQVIRRGLYGVSGLDPISYAGAIAILVAVLGIAAVQPVRRAFKLDVARILQAE